MSKWIKKDDKVLVIAGNEKGRVSTVVSRKGDKVVLQGLNIRKKHVKRKDKNARATIIDKEMPLHISNVSLCNDEGKAVKLRVRVNAGGSKELFYRLGDQDVVYRQVNKTT